MKDRHFERGFALLIVLWTLVLLMLLTTMLTASGRSEVRLAENLRDAAVAEAAADGAAYEAIFCLVTGQWAPGALPHKVRLGDAMATVWIEDEAGLINLNSAPLSLLAALLRNVGADSRTARTLANAIVQFRKANEADRLAYQQAKLPYGPAGRNFRDVSELRLVMGMTSALYKRVAPYLSVVNLPTVLDAASPVVVTAFRDAGLNSDFEGKLQFDNLKNVAGLLVVRITAVASFGGAIQPSGRSTDFWSAETCADVGSIPDHVLEPTGRLIMPVDGHH